MSLFRIYRLAAGYCFLHDKQLLGQVSNQERPAGRNRSKVKNLQMKLLKFQYRCTTVL